MVDGKPVVAYGHESAGQGYIDANPGTEVEVVKSWFVMYPTFGIVDRKDML